MKFNSQEEAVLWVRLVKARIMSPRACSVATAEWADNLLLEYRERANALPAKSVGEE